MASVEMNPENLIMLAHHIRAGELKTLKVKPRVGGKNKGILFADYAVKTPDKNVPVDTVYYRQRVAAVVEQAAKSIAAGENVRFQIVKTEDPERERYTYTYEVR